MQLKRTFHSVLILFILCITIETGYAQLGFSFDIKKPEQYDDRVLGSEKSDSKKFTVPRRFFQNTFTHYNYFFNANNKLNEVLARAKLKHRDDYSELLSFYNYSLDVTAADSIQLDSIIYKSTTGIVLHDLRNDWIDNLYLLTGAAYYLKQQYDSAYLTFQFINYAFADKEKDGYYKTIGSNLDGNNAFSIATKEKRSLPRKIFSRPPSRNEGFVWLARTLIAAEEYAEAASLIVTLKEDPVFPKRLQGDLEELQAWWFYRNNMYDSAAHHLAFALDNATNKQEKARWEYLIAQLYELSNKTELSKEFYDRAISHTIDPVMEIYARLNAIRINKEGGENYIDRNIADLLKMARRDKYFDYRDVIYYTVAQMELDKGDIKAAQDHLLKSTQNNRDNRELKNKAFLQLAELAYNQSRYRISHNYYDSLDLSDTLLKDKEMIRTRKDILNKIATQLEIIERQDSLLKIAAMPEADRREFVRKMVRLLRKQQGLKDEPGSALVPIGEQKEKQTDLFAPNSSKGEWYFYNASLKKKGLSDFKATWGNRPNADNWRRLAGISFAQANKTAAPAADNLTTAASAEPPELTFDGLYDMLPLTEEQKEIAYDSISKAIYILGKALAEEVEDCGAAITWLEKLRTRFPEHEQMADVLFTLYYCYHKSGQTAKSEEIKRLLEQKHPDSRQAIIVSTGKDPEEKTAKSEATQAYEEVYDLFIEGDYTTAISKKEAADKLYGSNYWTPQLLYIEAVYQIKQRDDSSAQKTLKKIIQTFPETPMAEKATVLSDVLSRRKQIEEELKNLEVERPAETIPKPADTTAVATAPPIVKTDNTPAAAITKPKDSLGISSSQATSLPARPQATGSYLFKNDEPHSVIILLNKTDLVWVNEAKNAFNIYNRGNIYNRQFTLNTVQLSPDYRGVLIGRFDNAQDAIDYIQVVKPLSPSRIVPWLKPERYSFSIISDSNLELLKAQQNVSQYEEMARNQWPGKF